MKYLILKKTFSKFLIVLALSIGFINQSFGQSVTSYNFFSYSTPFIPLTGGTPVPAIQADDAASAALPIGFTFNYLGTAYTQLFASSNGVLSFGAGVTSTINDLTAGTGRPILAPLWDDLHGASGSPTYATVGSPGSRIFIFEWLNWRWYYTVASPTISFQCKLYEATGAIEFIYRGESAPLNASEGASIGITALATGSGNFLSLSNSSAAPTVSSTTETTTINVKPADNQGYLFTPLNSSNPNGNVGPQVPALASFNYDILTDTAWIQSPHTFVNTSNNLVRSYWDVTAYSSVSAAGPYTAWSAPRICGPVTGAGGCYIDTTSLNFKYTFPTRGWYKVKLKARGVVLPLDSIEKVVYADTPSAPPVIDFFSEKRIVGIFDQVGLYDISNNGPNQWNWYTNPACVTCGMFPNSFSPNNTDQNPKFNAFDGGTYDLCLSASNIRGTSTVCKSNYLRVVPGYQMCNGSDSVSRENEGVAMLYTIGGLYYPSSVGSCPSGFRISACADSINLVVERYRFRNTDTLDVRVGGLNGTIIRKYGGNTFNTINDSLKTIRIPGGEVFLRMRLSPTSGTPGPNDSGFAVRWYSTPASYTKPGAAFVCPDTIYSGYRVNYQNTTTGVNVSYAWDTDGDGAFGLDQSGAGKFDSTGLHASRIFINAGPGPMVKRIGLKATNCKGVDTAFKDIVILPVTQLPVAAFTVNRTTGFTTDTFRFTDKTTNGVIQWRWRFVPGNVTYLNNTDSTSQYPVVFLNSATSYTVTLIATNQTGSDEEVKTSYVEALAYTSPNTANAIPTGTDIGISRVVLNGIDTSTALQTPIYLNLSNIKKTTLFRGVNYTLDIHRINNVDPMSTKVWIDFNRNARFNETGETILSEIGQNKVKTSTSFMIPNDAPVGNTRMRIGVSYGSTALTFNAATIGCFEDYGIEVGQDMVKPVLNLIGLPVLRMEVNKPYVEPGVTATDNLEGNISSRYVVEGTVNTSQVGYYELKYYVTDLYGNTSDTVIRIVQVEINQTGPSITLNGADTMMIGVGATFTDPGAVALDNLGNNISNQIVKLGTLDNQELGYYDLTYRITDAFGFMAQKVRVVEVKDTIKPVIRIIDGAPRIEHQLGVFFDDAQYIEVTDNYWKNLVPVRSNTSIINVNVPGTYNLLYTVEDGSGNAADPFLAVVEVKDRQAPVAKLKGLEEMEIEVFSTYNEPGYTATDNLDPNVRVTINSNLNTSMLGNYTITYTFCDAANNCVVLTRTVKVVDRTRPRIVILGNNPFTHPRFAPYNDPGVDIRDNYNTDAELRPLLKVDMSKVITHVPGYYLIKYNVTDLSGNKAFEEERLVQVIDVTTGATEIAGSKGLYVYPNPSENGMITIHSEKATIQEIVVTDLLGKIVLRKQYNPSGEIKLDLSDKQKGIYFVSIKDNTGKVNTTKLTLR